MAGINKVILLGRLGKDPELKYTAGGQAVCTFSLATSENWTDKGGQKQERTEWHNIQAWGKLAELCNQYLAKGRQAYLEGKLQTSSWEGQDGQKKYKTEIIASAVQFIGGASEGAPKTGGAKPAASTGTANDHFKDETSGFGGDFTADDIPF